MSKVTDEELMAFADGAMDEPRFTELAALVEADQDVAERLEALVVGGRAASAVYGGLADLPVPVGMPRHINSIDTQLKVVPLPVRRLPRIVNYAMAACVAALIAAPVGYLIGQNGAPVPLVAAGAPPSMLVSAELGRLPSGQEARLADGSMMRAIATFAGGNGQLCREFELDGALATVAVTCWDETQWRVAIAVDAPIAADGYAPASSIAALDAFLGAIDAGEPMAEEDERAALAQL